MPRGLGCQQAGRSDPSYSAGPGDLGGQTRGEPAVRGRRHVALSSSVSMDVESTYVHLVQRPGRRALGPPASWRRAGSMRTAGAAERTVLGDGPRPPGTCRASSPPMTPRAAVRRLREPSGETGRWPTRLGTRRQGPSALRGDCQAHPAPPRPGALARGPACTYPRGPSAPKPSRPPASP